MEILLQFTSPIKKGAYPQHFTINIINSRGELFGRTNTKYHLERVYI